ncbi:MAG: LVIVD repeat-containing protein, partial [Longimicrobiales bacterium]
MKLVSSYRIADARFTTLCLASGLLLTAACASTTSQTRSPTTGVAPATPTFLPTQDPRVGLGAGLMNAQEAVQHLNVLAKTTPPPEFVGITNSDLAFTGNYAIQGNYNGFMVWDITNPRQPTLVKGFVCPASQNDISVYKNLLFLSSEAPHARLDCGRQGVADTVSAERLRGIRIFDITDIRNPRYITNVQTCRGSHTHTVLADPKDPANVYVYVSGSSFVRPAAELAGCSGLAPKDDPNSALFRIEVIKVPLANPAAAAIVSSPRIFNDLVAPPTHGLSVEDIAELDRARARGEFIADIMGQQFILPPQFTLPMLDSIVKARGGTGAPTRADSATLRAALPEMINRMIGPQAQQPTSGPRPGPTQCHDITVYPSKGLAGGACEGYGFLLDISDPVNPRRIAAVSDSNFAYWHSATFNNDGTKLLFSDEWGGGGGAKCRASDPKEWGADAIFTIENRQSMTFRSYYKISAPQTAQENCVAHNGSMIPIPGRDVMVQAWYQGGISVFDWTDAANPKEIAFFDRGPVD